MKLRLFVLLACLYLGVASREPPWGDAHVVYETTQNLVDHGRIDVGALQGPPQFFATHDGKRYGVFPLGNVVAMAPGYLAYKALSTVLKPAHLPNDLLFRLTSHLSPSLLIAAVCALFLALARREGASSRAALWLALALGTTTILVVYARSPYSEALQTLLVLLTVERGLTLGERLDVRTAATTGLAAGLLVHTKIIYVLLLPVVAGYALWMHRRRGRALVGPALAGVATASLLVGLAVLHNHLKTGSFTDTGYQIPDGVFSGDAYAAFDGFFFSTGKSIFLYSPILVLGFLGWPDWLRRRRAQALFVMAVCAVVVAMNCKFRYWHADYCWGPRLLVPITPLLLLPAAGWLDGALARGRRTARALLVGGLVGAGLWVQLLGSAFYWDHYIRIAIAVKDQTGAPGWFGEDLHHCHFIPEFSPLVGHAWMLEHLARGDDDVRALEDAPWRRVAPGKVVIPNEWRAVRFDWWGKDWFVARAAGGAPVAGACVLALLLLGVGWAAVGLETSAPRRRLRTARAIVRDDEIAT